MSEELAMAVDAPASDVNAMGNRVAAKNVGFDPVTIITIITTIIGLIQGCKKPANQTEAKALVLEGRLLHRRNCPIRLRSAFRANGVDHRDDINDLWTDIVDDANAHHAEAAAALVSA